MTWGWKDLDLFSPPPQSLKLLQFPSYLFLEESETASYPSRDVARNPLLSPGSVLDTEWAAFALTWKFGIPLPALMFAASSGLKFSNPSDKASSEISGLWALMFSSAWLEAVCPGILLVLSAWSLPELLGQVPG